MRCDEPFITSSASCAAGWPLQVADMAAHEGTTGVGDGEGDGDGLGVGLGLGDVDGDGVGDGRAATGVVLPHAASRAMDANAHAPTRRLTGHRNDSGGVGGTGLAGGTRRSSLRTTVSPALTPPGTPHCPACSTPAPP